MDYKIRVYLPSSDKFDYVDELKNRQSLAISKYIKANDDYGLCEYFNTICDKAGCKDLIDKFAVLIQLRALNLNNNVTLNAKHISGSNATFKINMFTFLGKFLEYTKKLDKEYNINISNSEYIVRLPTKLYFKNIISLLADCLVDIKQDQKSVYSVLSTKERASYLLSLDDSVIKELKKQLSDINKSSNLTFCQPENDVMVPTVKISFFNNTIFNVLKSIFKTEISYFYNKFFICLTKLGLSYSDFLQLSYVETDILLNIYKSANKLK